MAFLTTAEQDISQLICRLQSGNETAEIRSQEQAVAIMQQNHFLAETLKLGKHDPFSPASTYHEL